MADLSVLANIPGLGGYLAKKQMNDQQGMQELQQAGSLMQLQQRMMEQKQAQEQIQRNEALRTAIAALPPEKRTKENVLPLILQHAGNVKDIIPALKEEPKMQPVGAGGIYDPTTQKVIPPANLPKPATPSKVAQLTTERDALPANDPRRKVYDAAILKETERAPQSFPIVQTADGIFERRPGGLVRLVDPKTQQPLAPKPTAAEGLTPENAGKVAMSQQAVAGVDTVRGIIFDKDGKINRAMVMQMNLPIVSGMPGNSQARIARTAIRNAVEAKLRIETGAAATESEVERTLARFLPTLADTNESAKFKLDELQKFFRNALSMTKGLPKTAPAATPTVESLLEKYK
jgi:hypothetical protein